MVPFPLDSFLSTLFIMESRFMSFFVISETQRLLLPFAFFSPCSFNESNAIQFRRDFIVQFFYDEIVVNNTRAKRKKNNNTNKRNQLTNKKIYRFLCLSCENGIVPGLY